MEVLVKSMSVAPQSFVSRRHRRKRKAAVASEGTRGKSQPQAQLIAVPSRSGNPVQSLPEKRIAPSWMRSLLVMQRSSDLVTLLLVASTLAVYAWTVYTQQQWTREYRKLDNLQRQERQMTATNEVLKNQLAQQAENPDTGLVAPSPANSIFLSPAPQRQSQAAPAATASPEPNPKTPLGY